LTVKVKENELTCIQNLACSFLCGGDISVDVNVFECLVENLRDVFQARGITLNLKPAAVFVLHLDEHEQFAPWFLILRDILFKGTDWPDTIIGFEAFLTLNFSNIFEQRLDTPIFLFLGRQTWRDCNVKAEETVEFVEEFAAIFFVGGD